MNRAIIDHYPNYLLNSIGQATDPDLSRLLEGDLSHYQITRTLASEKLTSKSWWRLVKAFVMQI